MEHQLRRTTFLPLDQKELDRNLFWTRRERGGGYMGLTIWAVRTGDWKLVKNDVTGEFMLFNLGDDPYETTDLSGCHLAPWAGEDDMLTGRREGRCLLLFDLQRESRRCCLLTRKSLYSDFWIPAVMPNNPNPDEMRSDVV